MSEVKYLQVEAQDEGMRLDNFLMRELKGVPKSHIYRMIRDGQVRVNKKRVKPMSRLGLNDAVRIPPVRTTPPKEHSAPSTFWTKQLDEALLYENDAFMVLNKPAGMAVHGGSGVSLGVIETLRATRVELKYMELVHRLDKDTSGCLLIAKKKSALKALQAQFADKTVCKTYVALLYGHWHGKEVRNVDAPLSKQVLSSGERVVRIQTEGKASQTRFELIENYEDCCLVEASPQTGRTHQIRVHSASMKQAIVGDDKYHERGTSLKQCIPKRLYLHAYSIRFNLDGKLYHFIAPMDARFISALSQLGPLAKIKEKIQI